MYLALPFKQDLKALSLLGFGDRIDHGERRRVGPRRILEAEYAVVLDLFEQVHGFDEIIGRLAWESHNDVGGERDVAPGGLDPADALEIPVASVLARHELEHAGRARLHGQVHVVAEGGHGVDGFDDVTGEVARVARGEANAADAGDLADSGEEFGEAQLPFRVPVAVDVLAEELDLGVAEVGDAPRFVEHRG